ncbi:MAG: class I SAM-dependent methyltransferase [Actinobacteria bacterium]|nr:MAG: class I SAM-dependent methyltransferase [Actinomycetota bacterium]
MGTTARRLCCPGVEVRRGWTARRAASAAARRIPHRPFRLLMPVRVWRGLFRFWLSVLAAQPDKRRAVRELLTSYDDVYRRLDQAAIAYDGGVHVKHRLTRYHDFFVERVRPGERVLDLGSGKGELAHDLVVRSGASVVGIDNDPSHLSFARSRFRDDRLEFREGDLPKGIPEGHFDVVVMSNVLEHIDDRTELLRAVVASAAPSRLLFRVPVYARDWTVPLKEEVGLPPYWDPDHEIEYDPRTFESELSEAGLEVSELVVNWGEIWAVAAPR